MDAARILTSARRRAGVTQRELARRTGIAQPTISRIERRLVSPSVATLDRLLDACAMELVAEDRPGSGVDRTLIRERLAMTPSGRAHRAIVEWRGTAPFRRRLRPPTG